MTEYKYRENINDKDGNTIGCKEIIVPSAVVKHIRAEVIDECADLFSNILSDMTDVCGINCPVNCNWGTEESCKDMCKKWFLEQLKEEK